MFNRNCSCFFGLVTDIKPVLTRSPVSEEHKKGQTPGGLIHPGDLPDKTVPGKGFDYSVKTPAI